jgi:uncharacterized membrane protein
MMSDSLSGSNLLIITIITLSILSLIYFLNKILSALSARLSHGQSEITDEIEELISELKTSRKLLSYLIPLIFIVFFIYSAIKGSSMEPHVIEWLNLLVRWIHVIFGISWIGASFYFIFLENSLNRTEDLRDGLAGNLWAIHGGGFYYIEKYKLAPEQQPKTLHWFKYEAYFTWLSGIVLLMIVYYFNAASFMVDSAVMDIKPGTSIFIGIASLVLGWIFYDLLCKSAIVQRKFSFMVCMFIFISAMAFILSQFLSGRAAYVHIGAMIGTMMAGNVFKVIIPSQKALVRAAKYGKPLDPTLGQNAGLRSLHNNYFTLPVVFIMISNHFPSTFGHTSQWLVLMALTLASVIVRHYINLHEKGQTLKWLLPAATVIIISLVFVTAPKQNKNAGKYKNKVSFIQANEIIHKRCIQCHSSKPTDEVQVVAPGGVKFDTPEEITKMKERIMSRAVLTRTMPQANKTGITDEEREILGAWIEQGAKIN